MTTPLIVDAVLLLGNFFRISHVGGETLTNERIVMIKLLVFAVVALFCVAVVVGVVRSRSRPVRPRHGVVLAMRFVFYGMFLAGVSLLELGHSYFIRAKISKVEARPDEQRLTNCADFCDACGMGCLGLWLAWLWCGVVCKVTEWVVVCGSKSDRNGGR